MSLTVQQDLALLIAWVDDAPPLIGRPGSQHIAQRDVGMVLEQRRQAAINGAR